MSEAAAAQRDINSDLIGTEFEPAKVSWRDNDVMLYAVAVGATPDNGLQYVYEKFGPKVLPTWAVIPGARAIGGLFRDVKINIAKILHGDEEIELFRPLPAKATIEVKGRIADVYDKGKAAVIVFETTGEDEDGPLFRKRMGLFVSGAGGFGGDRGPSTKGLNAPPDREPDIVVEERTLPQQGAIYRLTGDRVPLHIDPEFAKAAGFPEPFMHGLCTYGFTGRAILKELCGDDPARFKSFAARFADQVYFGDKVITQIWKMTKGEAIVQAVTQKGNVVLSQAKATFDE